jgi:lipid-binding SYLF domain-containing protein
MRIEKDTERAMKTTSRRGALTLAGLSSIALLLPHELTLAQTPNPSQEQLLVDRARIVVEEFLNDPNFKQMHVYVQNAYAVVVLPDLLKAGFFVGAEYGKGVMLARDVRSGAWGDPAFFDLIGGSLGLQIGGKASDVIFTIMNDGAVQKILTSRFKLGTDASVAAGPVGAGVGAATTIQFGEDVYVFSKGMGLYGGLTLDGSVFLAKDDWNKVYYGRAVTPMEIIRDKAVTNTGSSGLRDALARF